MFPFLILCGPVKVEKGQVNFVNLYTLKSGLRTLIMTFINSMVLKLMYKGLMVIHNVYKTIFLRMWKGSFTRTKWTTHFKSPSGSSKNYNTNNVTIGKF